MTPTHSKVIPSDEMPEIPVQLRSDDNLARFLYQLTAADDATSWNYLDGAGERAVRDRYLEAAGKVRQMFLPFQQATADGQSRKELRDFLSEYQQFVDAIGRQFKRHGLAWSHGSLTALAETATTGLDMLASAKQRAVDIRVLTELWDAQAEQLRSTASLIERHIPEQAAVLRGLAGGLEVARSLVTEALDGTLVTEKTEED